MSYDVNILVNGSRCKQYNHNGKLFVEAKQGSEYTIEIKNNTWQRILAVCSVDGLDILSGKPALSDAPGYVISGHGVGKFDGFRVSDEKVAKFVFDYKSESYAASKEDGSERNVGVIGVRLFAEKVKPLPPPPTIIREEHHHHHHDYINPWRRYGTPIIWNEPTYTCCADSLGGDMDAGMMRDSSETYSSNTIPTKGANMPPQGLPTRKLSNTTKMVGSSLRAMNMAGATFESKAETKPEAKGFDMGTKWGEAKESRVVEVEFERGILALTTNIYYASRQSLIEMGVPLGSEKQVSFPEPFADGKYAKPPKGWKE
jgi:hypothetical protein